MKCNKKVWFTTRFYNCPQYKISSNQFLPMLDIYLHVNKRKVIHGLHKIQRKFNPYYFYLHGFAGQKES